MVKYKLISNSNYFIDDTLERICLNRGANINQIKNPNISDVIHYSKLLNMDKLVNVFRVFGQQKEVEVGVVVDSDP